MPSNEPYVRALYRIEQLLTGSLMTGDEERRILWRDWAVAIADEWAMNLTLRAELLETARENAYTSRTAHDLDVHFE